MNCDPLRIRSVTVLPQYCLFLTFEDGWASKVNLSHWISHTRQFQPLQDATIFGQVHLGDWGTSLVWVEDTIDMGADNLRNLAVEQQGGIGHERLTTWMHKHHLTQEGAAEAIGISRRMLNLYLSGAKPIPKTVWLACLGWEAVESLSI